MDREEKEFFFFGQDRERHTLGGLINSHRRIVLLGGAGSGKSMELFHLANSMKQEDNPFIPVYQRLNTYIDKDIEAFLPIGWQKFNQDRTVVFLDGLDEVQPQHFNTAIRRIMDFTQRYPRIRIIVSCRTNFFTLPQGDMPGSLEGFKVYQINDISLPEIKTYAEANYGIDGQQFFQDITAASLEDLAPKPFFLNILVKHYKDKGCFAASRAEIMEEALLIQFAENRKHFATTIPARMTKEVIFNQLEKVAYILEVMGRNYLTDEEMSALFPDQGKYEQLKFLPALSFDEVGGKWMFDHNNIQEFLAARVLTHLPSPELLQLIKLPGSSSIKPYWANTLSFYITLGNQEQVEGLLTWMAAFDPQMIVKFEPERVPTALRIKVVREIIEYYNDQQIWISSVNKFSLRDLARFGAIEDVIVYLLESLSQENLTYVTRINIIAVLEFMDRTSLEPYVDRCREVMLEQLNWEKADHHFIHAVLHAIGSLRLVEHGEKLETLVNRYKPHTNEYIRAGLYKLITNANAVEEYLEVFLAGMNLTNIPDAVQDRSDVTLMDEGHWLTEGLKQVRTKDGISHLVQFFADRRSRRSIYLDEFIELFKRLLQNILRNYLDDASLFDTLLSLFKTAGLMQDHTFSTILVPYFRSGDRGWQAFKSIWLDKELADFEKGNLMAALVDDIILSRILDEHINGRLSKEELDQIYRLLRDNVDLISVQAVRDKLSELAARINNEQSAIAVPIDWGAIHRNWNQESFNLLFDPAQFLSVVRAVFEKLGTESITAQQLMTLREQNNQLDGHLPYAVLRYLSNLAVLDRPVTLAFLEKNLQGKGFYYYQGTEIYRYLQSGNSYAVQLSADQEKFIADWSAKYAEETDLPKLIKEGHDVVAILWLFMKRTKVALSSGKLLDFTLFHDFALQKELDEPAVIEQLWPFLERQQIHERVLANLQNNDIGLLSWLDNAAYAIRNKISEAVPLIKGYLQNIENPDYKLEELMKFYWEFTGDSGLLREVAQEAKGHSLRQTAIRILLNSPQDRDFLVAFLVDLLGQERESINLRLFAGNMLMDLGSVLGLNFVANHILTEADPDADYGHLINQAYHLTDLEALQPLMKLLDLSRQPAFQSQYNFFESEVHKAIFNIGIQSRERFLAVKQALERFIQQHADQQPGLNFIKINIIRMEEQLIQQQAKGESLQEALKGYEEIAATKVQGKQ